MQLVDYKRKLFYIERILLYHINCGVQQNSWRKKCLVKKYNGIPRKMH